MAKVGYEVDFLPVGNGEKSGDAIAVRYGSIGNYKVMVVDGGTKESGQALVDHIVKHYETTEVDYLVNTHPDGDHASGLSVVLEQLTVHEIWLHRPWEHSDKICSLFRDGRITPNSLEQRLKDSLSAAYQLEELALEKGIPVYEPFAGSMIGEFLVLSPSKEEYLDLLPQFNKTPEAKEAKSLLETGLEATRAVIKWITETWTGETLSESGTTSAENESSVILYANFDGWGCLLTGDAGLRALSNAADYAELQQINLKECKFYQVPHHGSRNNVSPSILNRIVGDILQEGKETKTRTAFASASKTSTTHPRKVVQNAFIRRGVFFHVTRGVGKQHRHNMPDREGWSTAVPLEFSSDVED